MSCPKLMIQPHKAVATIYHKAYLLGFSNSQEISEAVADDRGPSDTLSEKVYVLDHHFGTHIHSHRSLQSH